MQDRPRFGSLLREYRLAAGLSQEALAELATMSADGISALERGANYAPQRETLNLLIRALGLTDEQRTAIERAAVRPSRPRKSSSRESRSHNLPRIAMPIYGREREIENVAALIAENPLVTLTGAGGVGKTRLALETGERLLDGFPDGVWFVDLAPIADPQLVPVAAAQPFGASRSPERAPAWSLADALRRKQLLLIVDNCEHVTEAAAELAQVLIRECPDVRVLATSRQSLNLTAEHIFRVASLDVEAGIELFAEHAKRSQASFEPNEHNRGTIARIVRRLDGIALAIELAAARLKLLTPEQLEDRLSERFRVLTGGSRTNLPRQQTMSATLDWSYDLLEEPDRKVFCRIASFAGSFSWDAAAAVCEDSVADSWQVFESLGSLVDKSLLVSEPAGAVQRYHMLESIREYALNKTSGSEEYASAKRRHAAYYAELSQRANDQLSGAVSAADWAAGLDPDLENFRAAVDWTLAERNDPVLGIRLLTNLQEYWVQQGFAPDALRYAQSAVSFEGDLPEGLRASLWLTLARMQQEFQMSPQALLESAVRACELYARGPSSRELAMALRERGIAEMHLGLLNESEADLRQSLEIARASSDLRLVSHSLGSLGCLRQIQGRHSEALDMLLEVLHLSKQIGDERGAMVMRVNVAETEFALGEAERAVARAKETLAPDSLIHKNLDIRANQQSNMAAYLFALGREDEAKGAALAAMQDANYSYAAVPMQHLAAVLAPHDPKRAARLLGYIEKVLASTAFRREITEQYTYDRLIDALLQAVGPDELARLEKEGAAMTNEQAMKLARIS